MVSHEIYCIGRRCRRDPIGCMWTPSFNRGSLLIEGHSIVTKRELIHLSFPPLSVCVLFCYTRLYTVTPTFRSLRRQKIELTKGRAKQTENALMKRLQPQNLCLP